MELSTPIAIWAPEIILGLFLGGRLAFLGRFLGLFLGGLWPDLGKGLALLGGGRH